jgi:S1-C subfamily serine protease
MQGQVVGINTLGAGEAEPGVQAEGIGFAISINQAKTIAQQLVTSGKVSHAMLGITSQPLTPAIASSLKLDVTQGTVVVQVQSGTAAAQAGLKQGDVITAIDGQKLTGESTLGEIINSHQPGDKVQLEVITSQTNGGSGQPRTIEVTLGERTSN